MTSPTQVALRELMILTKCYCGNYGEDPHPRLGHNCSFRPDVETVVAAVQRALALCDDAHVGGEMGDWPAYRLADEIRAALLGQSTGDGGATDNPPWRQEGEGPSVPG